MLPFQLIELNRSNAFICKDSRLALYVPVTKRSWFLTSWSEKKDCKIRERKVLWATERLPYWRLKIRSQSVIKSFPHIRYLHDIRWYIDLVKAMRRQRIKKTPLLTHSRSARPASLWWGSVWVRSVGWGRACASVRTHGALWPSVLAAESESPPPPGMMIRVLYKKKSKKTKRYNKSHITDLGLVDLVD